MAAFVAANGLKITAEFVEVETSKGHDALLPERHRAARH
jgi:hypothetical protein